VIDPNNLLVSATLKNDLEVSVRPIRPDDRDRFALAFRSLDRESVYTRFFRYVPELTDEDLKRATEVDPEREVALVVTIGSGADEIIIGAGRYIVSENAGGERRAELAFIVEEDYQGRGIAGLILRTLVQIGREQDVQSFEADVLAGNDSMIRVFARSGLPMKRRREGGVVHVELSLGKSKQSSD
jgi:RimJ/RimL family protein N-acetyltransferase